MGGHSETRHTRGWLEWSPFIQNDHLYLSIKLSIAGTYAMLTITEIIVPGLNIVPVLTGTKLLPVHSESFSIFYKFYDL